jgi:hypothetical protein
MAMEDDDAFSPPVRARAPSSSGGAVDAPACGHDSGSGSNGPAAGVKTALRLVFARGAGLPPALVDEAFDLSREEWGPEQHDLRAVMEALFAIAPEVRFAGAGAVAARLRSSNSRDPQPPQLTTTNSPAARATPRFPSTTTTTTPTACAQGARR